ncbi:MAG: DUF1592 domain-containing protein [Bradymonadaceae bacterium]|nr:DUF1592 domain-containing protein [Lujinxingiaceae bacterium]
MRNLVAVLSLTLICMVGCDGRLDLGEAKAPAGPSNQSNNANNTNTNNTNIEINTGVIGVAFSGARRLSRDEYDNTLRDLLEDGTRPGALLLPEDSVDPFDNDYRTQYASMTLIEAVEALADSASERLLADTARRDRIVGCSPRGPDDAVCMRRFIETFGRRAMRRALRPVEVERFLALQSFAVEDNNFYSAVDLVVRAMLQQPEFLYRVERGIAVEGRPGVFRLNHWEMASRLSYLLWGTKPDDWVLDLASEAKLGTSEEIRAAATRMLEDPRAVARVERFHAMWLGYHQIPHPTELATALRAESDALVRRVIFEEKRSWLDLFRVEETFVGDYLVEHYGLSAPSAPAPRWVAYGDSGRRGILSHGSFLSVAAKFDDTSPTQRGLLIRNRLMCEEIEPPPPTVDVDQQPHHETSPCKADAYAGYMQSGCGSCHGQMDPIGFGLENYDRAGRYRAHDNGYPECAIEGSGELIGIGGFKGPAELGQVLIDNDVVDRCLVTQVFRFAMGQRETKDDEALIDALHKKFRDKGYLFDELLLDFVTMESFSYRMEE